METKQSPKTVTATLEVPEITWDRIQEINNKIAERVKVVSTQSINPKAPDSGFVRVLEMPYNVPDSLIGLGFVKDEKEAVAFLTNQIASGMFAVSTGQAQLGEVLHSLVKFGFLVGVLASEGKRETGVN